MRRGLSSVPGLWLRGGVQLLVKMQPLPTWLFLAWPATRALMPDAGGGLFRFSAPSRQLRILHEHTLRCGVPPSISSRRPGSVLNQMPRMVYPSSAVAINPEKNEERP